MTPLPTITVHGLGHANMIALALATVAMALITAGCGIFDGHSTLAMTTFNDVYET